MKWFHWLGLMIAGGLFVFGCTMAAHAQEGGGQPDFNRLVVEWHVRAYVQDKDRHPVLFADYGAKVFKTGKECLAALAKPDANLVKTHKDFDAQVKKRVSADVTIDWTCVTTLVPGAGDNV